MSSFVFENHDCENLDELIDLTKTYYSGGDIVNKDYIKWQYLQNPFGKPFLVVTRVEDSKELAGQYLVIPQEYTVNNKVHKGALSLNTLTKKEFQGKGLFTKMALKTYELCQKNSHNIIIGFPNQQSYPGFVKKLNFKYLGNVPLLVKPIKPFNVLVNKLRKKEKHGGEITLNFSNESTKFSLLSFEHDQPLYEKFWEIYSSQTKLQTHKSWAYINWRYKNIPTRNYTLFKSVINNKMIGLVALRGENTLGNRTALIMDLMLLNGAELLKEHKAFLSIILKNIKHSKIDLLASIMNENTFEYRLLKQKVFFKVPQFILPQPIPFITRTNQDFDGSHLIDDLTNWHLCFGDYDVF
ncbi:MAG: GNAT family N-acetyltransferase [Bacteroidales bacterium]|nr:GNAT family N-acetyltransferase [Bacteroidales bacterium]